jgi:hypothetical protein
VKTSTRVVPSSWLTPGPILVASDTAPANFRGVVRPLRGRFDYGPLALSTCSCGAARIAAVAPGLGRSPPGATTADESAVRNVLPRRPLRVCRELAELRWARTQSTARGNPLRVPATFPVQTGNSGDVVPSILVPLPTTYLADAAASAISARRGKEAGPLAHWVLAKLLRHVRVRHGRAESVNAGASPEPCAHELSNAGASPEGCAHGPFGCERIPRSHSRMGLWMRAHRLSSVPHSFRMRADAGADAEQDAHRLGEAPGSIRAGAQCGALCGQASLQLPRPVSRLPQARLPGLLVKGEGVQEGALLLGARRAGPGVLRAG